VLLAALVLLLVPVVAVGGYLVYLNKIVTDNIRHDDLLGTPKSLTVPTGDPTPGSADVIGPGGKEKAYTAGKVVQGPGENYLVIGSDARPGDTFSRSDVIVLVRVAADHKTVSLIHFPRDLYVAIPGRNNNKINAAYAFGGAPLLVQTVQNLVGVKIDHVAKTDFSGFKGMIDAVGGIRVWAEEASSGRGNGGAVAINKGWNELNGTQALAFVRERYELSEGDISRGRRQMAVIKALILKTVSRDVLLNPGRLASFVDAATSNLTVDNALSVGTMRSEAFKLRGVRSGDIGFVTAPFTGFAYIAGAGSVDVVDEAGMQQLAEALQNDRLSSYDDRRTTP
jgi:LCP family protein required for cell wall assembly